MSGQAQDFSTPLQANLMAEMARLDLTVSQVAAALEVSERQVTRWRGGQQPRYAFVVRLGRLFGREPAWLYTDHESVKSAA